MTDLKKVSLIDRLLNGAEDAVADLKKPFLKKKIKNGIKSAIESAEEQSVDADIRLETLRGKLITHPEELQDTLNEIVGELVKQDACTRTVEKLQQEQIKMFKVEE